MRLSKFILSGWYAQVAALLLQSVYELGVENPTQEQSLEDPILTPQEGLTSFEAYLSSVRYYGIIPKVRLFSILWSNKYITCLIW